jgi:hypothetical protein
MSLHPRYLRWRGAHWPLRRDLAEYVRVSTRGGVQVVVLDRSAVEVIRALDGTILEMDRRTARLLARRLDELLARTA